MCPKKDTIFVSDRGKSVYQLHIKCLRYFPFWQINWVKLLFRRDPWLFSSDRNIYHYRNSNAKWKHLLFFIRVCLRGEKHNKSQSQTLKKPVLLNTLKLSALVASAGCTGKDSTESSCRLHSSGRIQYFRTSSSRPFCRRCLRAGAAESQQWSQQHADVLLPFRGAAVERSDVFVYIQPSACLLPPNTTGCHFFVSAVVPFWFHVIFEWQRSPFLEMTPEEVVWGCRISILECRGDVLIHAVQGEPTLHLKTGQGFFSPPFFSVCGDVLHTWIVHVTR